MQIGIACSAKWARRSRCRSFEVGHTITVWNAPRQSSQSVRGAARRRTPAEARESITDVHHLQQMTPTSRRSYGGAQDCSLQM